MSDSTKAVFLSYASQDAEAAKRICEVLRAAGVEVWFDQNELVGGDQWDAKIRGQISSCALFVPVISVNTQARLEGYFRIEWKLAAQRTHAMADEKAFLLPVVIDGTRDSGAKVPAEFKAVQWTRLPGGETPPAFASRIRKVLDADVAGVVDPGASRSSPGSATPATTRLTKFRWWWLMPIFGAAMAVVLIKEWQPGPISPPAAAPVSAPESAAWQHAQRALDLFDAKEGVSRERLETADDLCRRALELDPLDGRIFAVAARVDASWVYYQMDKSEARQQLAKNRVARAGVLAPGHPQVRLAQAFVYASVIGTPAMQAEAEKLFRGLRDDPALGHSSGVGLGTMLRDMGRAEEAALIFEQLGDLGSAGWAYQKAGRYDEVRRVADALLARGHSANAIALKCNVIYRQEDLPAMAEVVRQFTPEDLLNDTPAQIATHVALFQRDAGRVLEVAAAFPRDYYSSSGTFGPKRYYTGWAHRLAGRPELAQADWRAALATVQELLKGRPNDLDLLGWAAVIQGWLGEQAEAEKSLRFYLSLSSEPAGADAVLIRMLINLGLGRTEESIQQLLGPKLDSQQLRRIHRILRFSPEYDALRGDPRFENFLRETLPKDAKPFPAASPIIESPGEIKT